MHPRTPARPVRRPARPPTTSPCRPPAPASPTSTATNSTTPTPPTSAQAPRTVQVTPATASAGHHHDEPDGGEHRPSRQHVAAEHGGRRGRRRRASHQVREAGHAGSGRAEAGRYRPPRTRRDTPAPRPSPRRRRTAPRHPRRRPPSAATPPPRPPPGPHTPNTPAPSIAASPRTTASAVPGRRVTLGGTVSTLAPGPAVISRTSVSLASRCGFTARAPGRALSTRQEPDDRACEVTIQHSTLGHDVDERQRADVVTELHLLTGAGTTAATATADAVVVGVLPARSDDGHREGRTAARPGRGGGRRGLRRRARGAARRGGRDRPGGRGRQDPHAAGRSPRRWSSPSGSARPGTTARRPSSCAAPPGRRPARWPARTTR